MYSPNDNVSELKGLGKSRAAALEQSKDIATVGDLLTYYPRRYIDRQNMMSIDALEEDIEYEVAVKGRIQTIDRVRSNSERLEVVITDGTGKMKGVWFRGLNVEYALSKLKEVIFVGKPSRYGRMFSIAHPDFFDASKDLSNSLNVGRIVPLYPSSDVLKAAGLSDKVLRQVVWDMLQAGVQTTSVVPKAIADGRKLMPLAEAVKQIHFPDSWDHYEDALKRLQWEELFPMQYGYAQKAADRPTREKLQPIKSNGLYAKYVQSLPFELTTAQSVALTEITAEMYGTKLMSRLLQGDVGSGKTVVATAALLYAVDNELQGAFMAPTSVLAEQHYRDLSEELEAFDVRVELLTGNQPKTKQDEVRNQIAMGNVDIAIGTHALIDGGTTFNDLGLAVIDEQHRFGVDQRRRLTENHKAHVLLMTATPIPRSLTLVQYGDTTSSVIDEMPPGRKAVETYWHIEAEEDATDDFIEEALEEDHQVYVVCPLVEESGDTDLTSATAYVSELQSRFPDADIALVHGQLPPSEKDETMGAFEQGQYDILVSTTVIEVGVNVPNATVMIIRDANQFGLSQLHQLRGRVGRSDVQSYCILVTEDDTEEAITDDAYERLMTMTETNDGFEISEVDLQLRGAGDVAGSDQSGTGYFKLVDLTEDPEILQNVLGDARYVIRKEASVPDRLVKQAESFNNNRDKFGVS